jgi:hypothetical protein
MNPSMHDLGKVIRVHPKRGGQGAPEEPQPIYVPVPVLPSEKAARRRKIWEGPKPESEPVTEPEKEPVKVGGSDVLE